MGRINITLRQQDDELVAAIPKQNIRTSKCSLDRVSDLPKDLVADISAECAVDQFH